TTPCAYWPLMKTSPTPSERAWNGLWRGLGMGSTSAAPSKATRRGRDLQSGRGEGTRLESARRGQTARVAHLSQSSRLPSPRPHPRDASPISASTELRPFSYDTILGGLDRDPSSNLALSFRPSVILSW